MTVLTNQFKIGVPWQPSGSQPQAIAQMTQNLQKETQKQTLLGITGSGKTFSIAKTIENVQVPAIILAPNKTLAAQLYSEFKEFFPNNAVEYFVSYFDYYQPEAYVPSTDTFIEKDSSINEQIEQMRLSATKSLIERKDVIIVATVSAIYGLGNPKTYSQMVLKIFKNQKMSSKEIIKRLIELQYTRNNTQLDRGTFRVRGDIVDIHPSENEENAIRIELFDDQIDTIKIFDPLTGKTHSEINSFSIYAKNHYVTEKTHLMTIIPEIKNELDTQLKFFKDNNKLVEAQRLEQRVNYDIEMMQQIGYCKGIENYSRYLTGGLPGEPPPCLFDYMPKDALIIIDESHVTVPQLGAMYKGDRSRKENLVNYGFRLPSALDNRPLKFEEFITIPLRTIYVSATPSDYEINQSQEALIEQLVRPTGLLDPEVEVRPASTQVDDLLGEIKKRTENNERVLVTTLTKKMAEDLSSYLGDLKIKAKYLHSDIDTIERGQIINDLRRGVFDVLIGINLLREGLDLPEVSLVAILDADKEGFLRSYRSLIQTIGRAARNLSGKAILYGDRVTDSMQKAILETERRRKVQIKYSKKNGIIPQGINKEIKDAMGYGSNNLSAKKKKIKDGFVDLSLIPQAQLEKMAAKLDKEMHLAAKNLEFEVASIKRDELKKVRERLLLI